MTSMASWRISSGWFGRELERRVDLIVEAVVEDVALKQSILAAAEERAPAVLASNTSSISIDELAEDLSHPDRFAGMHFFNPVWAMHLVEVIRGADTSAVTLERISTMVTFLGMEQALINDAPWLCHEQAWRPRRNRGDSDGAGRGGGACRHRSGDVAWLPAPDGPAHAGRSGGARCETEDRVPPRVGVRRALRAARVAEEAWSPRADSGRSPVVASTTGPRAQLFRSRKARTVR